MNDNIQIFARFESWRLYRCLLLITQPSGWLVCSKKPNRFVLIHGCVLVYLCYNVGLNSSL